ncbi:MAG: FAD-dependent oxidoreductase [Ilumatobacteraceae bacterium]
MPPIARILTGWSPHVTAFSNDLDAAVRAELGAHGVNVDERPIARVNGDGNTVSSLELTDGTDVPIGALFVAEWPAPNNQLAVELGCAVDEHGYVDVDAMKRTTVPDVWAIGDVTSLRSNMSMSITDGVLAAVDCNTALLDRDWNETT